MTTPPTNSLVDKVRNRVNNRPQPAAVPTLEDAVIDMINAHVKTLSERQAEQYIGAAGTRLVTEFGWTYERLEHLVGLIEQMIDAGL